MNVAFTYIVSSELANALFKRGFDLCVGAVSAAQSFPEARIGQIASRPSGFWTVIVNENELVERWGLQVVSITMAAVRHAITDEDDANSAELRGPVEEFRAITDFSRVSDEQITRLAALKLAFICFCEEHQLDAPAVNCAAPFRKAALGIRA
jgi:L-fucose isomerase-like protein